jgi:hypothetical protein
MVQAFHVESNIYEVSPPDPSHSGAGDLVPAVLLQSSPCLSDGEFSKSSLVDGRGLMLLATNPELKSMSFPKCLFYTTGIIPLFALRPIEHDERCLVVCWLAETPLDRLRGCYSKEGAIEAELNWIENNLNGPIIGACGECWSCGIGIRTSVSILVTSDMVVF